MFPSSNATRRVTLLALSLILAIGGGLRLYNLRGVPAGLWFDEALNAKDAADVWRPGGHFQIVYRDVFPREPMFETMLAVATKILGPRVEALRLCAALVGIATVCLLFAMVRREWGDGPALAAAGTLAALRWHAIFSRVILRTIVLPAWMIGLVWAALALRRKPTPARAAMLGLMLGGGFYTYLSWYLMLPLVGGIMLWLLWPRADKLLQKHAALAGLCGALVAAPILIHYARYPDDIKSRPGAVSPFSGGFAAGLQEIAKNAGQALGMFHYRGDHVPKQNIPHWPGLDPLQGLLFLTGLVLCIRRARQKDALACIALGWLVCGVAPTVFTKTDSPNFLRTLVVTPAVALIVALGIDGLARLFSSKFTPKSGPALAAVLIAASAAFTGWSVFGVWARSPEVFDSFNGAECAIARGAAEAPGGALVYVPEYIFQHRSFQYIATARAAGDKPDCLPYRDLAPLRASPQDAARERWIIVTAHNGLYGPVMQLCPGAREAKLFTSPAGNTFAVAIAIPGGALPSPKAVDALEKSLRTDLRF